MRRGKVVPGGQRIRLAAHPQRIATRFKFPPVERRQQRARVADLPRTRQTRRDEPPCGLLEPDRIAVFQSGDRQ